MATQTTTDGTPTNGANPWIDSLVWGGTWTDSDGGVVTLQYAAVDGFETSYEFSGDSWLENELEALANAMATWEAVANIEFVLSDPETADLYYWNATEEALSPIFGPGTLGYHEVPGDVFSEPIYGIFNWQAPGWNETGLLQGGYGFVTLIHELGHGLGLAHPHDGGLASDASAFPGVTDAVGDFGTNGLNQGIWTTMTYNDGWQAQFPNHSSETYGWQATPMALDIAAIQAIYGANTTYNQESDIYSLPISNGSGTFWSCIWDTGGVDTISAATAAASCVINLNAAPLTGANAGGFVSWMNNVVGGFTIANGVVIENATGGSAADTLTGNDVANLLIGNGGNDTLNGGAGDDTLVGGNGNDVYVVDSVDDVVTELALAGVDTVRSAITFSLASLGDVEKLTLTGTAVNATGNALDNLLTGNSGDNTLDGGTGNDTLIGAAGNDLYFVDSAGDVITELASAGTDTIQSTITFSLAPLTNVENLTLLGDTTINATGNSRDNVLTGNGADNTLNGGAGNDTLVGGAGNDLYVVGSASDAVTELAAGGSDTIQTTITFSLAALTEVENLTLLGSSAINATGNALDNALTGNGAANTLNGGAGNDALAGGGGNDLYIVDNAGDSIEEGSDPGIDTVQASITAALGANIENLTLTGTAALNGTGNELNNAITGNSGNNILTGGTGTDRLIGGAGNDTFIVNDDDTVVEASNQGIDMVKASVSFVLGTGVEKLTLTGSAAINGTGGFLNNVITGNSGKNTLNGGAGNDSINGGAGNDTLIGGPGLDALNGSTGQDIFLFNSALRDSSVDTIIKFSHVDDIIRLDNDIFTAIGIAPRTPLSAARYQENATGVAMDPSDRIIYNSTSGELYYDADGNGSGEAIRFAVIAGGPDEVDETDFYVVG